MESDLDGCEEAGEEGSRVIWAVVSIFSQPGVLFTVTTLLISAFLSLPLEDYFEHVEYSKGKRKE